MRERFEEIYRTREWGRGSGEGSAPRHTRGYVAFLQQFLKTRGIQSVVDLGCGDWQFSQLIDWTGILYQGFDLVAPVIAQNQTRFQSEGIVFHQFSGNFDDLPTADLLIVKDVLQHWSNRHIQSFLPILSRYPFALITNCVNPHGPTVNRDIPDGDFRYLDLRLPPFEMSAEPVFSFSNHVSPWLRPFISQRWHKVVLLAKNQ